MDISYFITPFLCWFVAGVTKFLLNSIKSKSLAFREIGYGGMPSNHTAIVSGSTFLIALKEGLSSPAFGVSITLMFIVVIDANSLRRQVGKQAKIINNLTIDKINKMDHFKLRERMGHTKMEIAAGICVGIIVAYLVFSVNNLNHLFT